MAITNIVLIKLPASVDGLPSLNGNSDGNAGTLIFGTADVTSNSGGAITAAAMGLSDIEGVIPGANVTADEGAKTVTVPNTTGSEYSWVCWGPDATKRQNS